MTTEWAHKGLRPVISLIVIVYNMLREAPRTLLSLSQEYQNLNGGQYEVIVVENGSEQPLSESQVKSFGEHFRYFYMPAPSSSPVCAINFGVSQATAKVVGVMIDGARILSPGILKYALLAFNAYENPFVTTLGWHLGPDVQFRSVEKGYNKQTEDSLIENIQWPSNGYRLFEIASLAGSSGDGWFLPITESNCFFMAKQTYESLRGFDERFDKPGGGLANLDFYKRACELAHSQLVVLFGEGTFHQLHGGVTTQVTEEQNRNLWRQFEDQYFSIRNMRYERPVAQPDFLGHVPPEALASVLFSAKLALKRREQPKGTIRRRTTFFRKALNKIYTFFSSPQVR